MSDNVLGQLKATFDAALGNPPHIKATHLAQMAPLLGRTATLSLLDAILAHDSVLDVIASRSYTHTLGFKKIVLLDPGLDLADGRMGYGYQLRLHIWEPDCDSGVAMIESMHEHSFDFVSHLLLGEMENQCYDIGSPDAELVARVQRRLADMQVADRHEVNRLLERAEAARLRAFGSKQGEELATTDREKLCELLGVGAGDVEAVVAMQGRYQAVASSVAEGGYTHRLVEMVNLNPYAVLRLRAGDTYHHPHRFGHRLFIPAGMFNATMILTTPVSQEAMGGSFQRPSWVPGGDVNYARRMYTTDELRASLKSFKQRLLSAGEPASGRQLDVAHPL